MKDGLIEEFWNNGKLKFKGNYKDGKKDGLWEEYHDNGQLWTKRYYKDGKKDGLWEEYLPFNGKLVFKTKYKDGKLRGFFEYHDNGQLFIKRTYKDGKDVNQKFYYYEGNDPRDNLTETEIYKDGKLFKVTKQRRYTSKYSPNTLFVKTNKPTNRVRKSTHIKRWEWINNEGKGRTYNEINSPNSGYRKCLEEDNRDGGNTSPIDFHLNFNYDIREGWIKKTGKTVN